MALVRSARVDLTVPPASEWPEPNRVGMAWVIGTPSAVAPMARGDEEAVASSPSAGAEAAGLSRLSL